ncbi:MAG TPA: carboxymuconolactone decarboxylase family protein [Planctomycetaceae bacterium]|nr:carboxymuconolactone decarboxylase family protein [Planctomycetaceae bacterium]
MQTITKADSQDSITAPSEHFTGKAQVVPHFASNKTTHYSAASVSFEPGARSAWHVHPVGQHIIVTSGLGRTAVWGGPVKEIGVGDVIWCPPGVKHWHGASPNSSMTHLVVTSELDRKNVEWMEKVTDEQYCIYNADVPDADSVTAFQALSAPEQRIITIAAFTASGKGDKLKLALNEGLDSGLTVNEIKEVLVQMYAYTGFPRSLNAINTFMSVVEERKAKGITDKVGKEAAPIPADFDKDVYGADVRARLAGVKEIAPPSGYQLFTPVIDTFLKEHLFADIFVRDVLNHQQRELATIAALANMSGTEGQLRFHLGAALNTGLTEDQLKSFIAVLAAKVSKDSAATANNILAAVLDERSSSKSRNNELS